MSAHEPQVPPVLAEDFGVALDPRRDHSMEMRRSTESSQSGDETPLANSAVIGKLPATVRRTVGIILLLTTVFFWTASNFLASVSGEAQLLMVFINELRAYSPITHTRNPSFSPISIHHSSPYH